LPHGKGFPVFVLGAEKLVDSGFDSVYRLEGNFQAWVDEGYVVEPSDSYIDITVHQAKSMIDSNPELIVIDVSPNYDDGHIPGAVNYYVGDGSLDDAIPILDMNKDYLVYCHVDSAAILGAETLVDAGFDPVYRLEGNYVAWVDAGYPVES
jgi:rhodanese-related sulfurtransferase